jgi:membrane associated rhomboid family serine protease
MEILITLVLIGLVVFLFPYILAGLVIASGLIMGVLAGIVLLIKKIFGR